MAGEIVAMFRKHQSIKLEFRLGRNSQPSIFPCLLNERGFRGELVSLEVGPGSSASRRAQWLLDE